MQSFLLNPKQSPQQAQQRADAYEQQLASNMPTDVSSGMQAVMQALMVRNGQANAAYPSAPSAPAGAPPMSLGSTIMNKLGMNRGGGLF